ncbi:hypothetical protein BGZ97_010699 [Linnemannia gamsii]|uniref:Uncharacterized protein n=1 Tax=Linnemannia gamsii TaxID=64522 RepID=A0A9P6UMI2_9FUNG|nr:hypothetical protein BGZ97_010699 [Linnemannia gamsii]
MHFMHIHPLSLPEIILIVGKYIPLWVTRDNGFNNSILLFQPKDLIAALSVNRLFYTTLTPFLWTVCVYHHNRTQRYLGPSYRGTFSHSCYIDAQVFQKNLIHVRYLHLHRVPDIASYDNSVDKMLLVGCTDLHELRLLREDNVVYAGQLIQANPGLRRLQWTRSAEPHPYNAPKDLKVLFGLCQLRYLSLKGWAINAVYLQHILHNNADTLEELELGGFSKIVSKPRINNEWSGLDTSIFSLLTDEDQGEAAELMQGRPLLLPKVKTLHLQVCELDSRTIVCNLVRAFPALETLMLGHVDAAYALRLSRALKEFCPNLRSIQDKRVALHDETHLVTGFDEFAIVVGGCMPRNLGHLVLSRAKFVDNLAKQLISSYGDSLEVLEVRLSGVKDTQRSVDNICKVLLQCSRLRELSVYNQSRIRKGLGVSRLLLGVRTCRTLEKLSLVGFPFAVSEDSDEEVFSEEKADKDNEDDGEGEDEDEEDEEDEEGEDKEGGDEGGGGDDGHGTEVKGWRATRQSRPVFQLLPGWSQSENKSRRNMMSPSDSLKTMVFETAGELPVIKTIILNNQRFEKTSLDTV